MDPATPLLVDTGRGFTLQWKKRYLLSPYNPKEKCEKTALSQKLQSQTLYLLIHPLFGYGLNILLEKLPENSFILCIEPQEEIFAVTAPRMDTDRLDPCYGAVYRSENPYQWIPVLEKLGLWRFRRCLPLSLGCGLKEERETQWIQMIQGQLNLYWKNRLTLIRLGSRWFSNIVRNIPELNRMEELPETEKPLILCGAGPSLEGVIPDLSHFRDKLFILAVDTALPALSSRGILPDAVVNVDGQFYNFMDFYFQDTGILKISDLSAYPASLRSGRNVLFSSRFTETPFLRKMEDILPIPFISPMGSVALSALELGRRINPEGPVILTGMDFAYPPGKTHARGSIFHSYYLQKQNRLSPDGGLSLLSLRRNPQPMGSGSLKTDGILRNYHRDLLEYLQGLGGDFYQWGLEGLPLPLEEFDPVQRWGAEPVTQERSPYSRTGTRTEDVPSARDKKEPKKSWQQLPEHWKKELELLINLWEKFADGQIRVDKILETIKPMDYLYFDSPANPPEPEENLRTLTLLVRRARKLLALMERI